MATSSSGAAQLIKAVAVTVVLGGLMALLPGGPLVILPFLVLPVAFLEAQGRLGYALVVILASTGLLCFVADLGTVALTFLVLAILGMGLGIAVRKGWTFGKMLGATAGAAAVALVLWGLTLWGVFGLGLTEIRSVLDSSIADTAELYTQMGVSQSTTEAVTVQMRHFLEVLPYVFPGLLGAGCLLLAGCCVVLAYALFPRFREGLRVHVSLTNFRVHWGAAYGFIAGLALVVISRTGGAWGDIVLYVGLNVLLVSLALFFFQGLAVIHWYGTSRQLSAKVRGVIYVGTVVAQALLQLPALLGLFDTWLDCRRRFALDHKSQGPVA